MALTTPASGTTTPPALEGPAAAPETPSNTAFPPGFEGRAAAQERPATAPVPSGPATAAAGQPVPAPADTTGAAPTDTSGTAPTDTTETTPAEARPSAPPTSPGTLAATTVTSGDKDATALRGRVALIGIPGLEWSDIDQAQTPNLWRLMSEGSSASLSTRTVPPSGRGITCPIAGWLTVSAGQRAGTPDEGCPAPPTPQQNGEGATIPGWNALVAYQPKTGYAARIGTLGQIVADGGGKVAAIGPGAALAAADKSGNITKYAPTPSALGDPAPYSLIVFDVPDLATAWAKQPRDEYGIPTGLPVAARKTAAAEADRRIGDLLALLPPRTTILLAGISDITPNAHLHVAIATGPSPDGSAYRHGYLTATSTRQDALVTISDLTATAIQALGLTAPREVVGRPWQSGAPAPATPAEVVTELAGEDLASQVLREVRGPFFTVLVTAQLLFYALAALTLRRRRPASTRTTKARPGLEGPKRSPIAPEPTPPSPAPAQPSPAEASQIDTPGESPGSLKAQPSPAGIPADQARPRPQRTDSTRDEPAPAEPTGPAQPTGTTEPTRPAQPTGTTEPTRPAQPTGTTEPTRPAQPTGTTERTSTSATTGNPASGSKLLKSVQVVAVVSGAIAVSTFLAQLIPWWTLPVPMLSVIVTILGIAVLITAVAFAGPWRAHVLGPLTTVAAITSVALLLDVMTGSTLQVNAVSGYEPVTGGRFYGFSNIAFAIYSTGTILGLAGIAHWLLGKRMPRAVVVTLCAAYGGFAVFADGWPSWGADFGGVPAFVIGLAVFLILLSGKRVSPLRLLLVGLAGAALVGVLSVIDWLRPESQRTHLGAFVQQIIDGEAWTVVGRKFAAMVGVTVGNWSLTLLSLVALAFLFLVLARPSRWGVAALGLAYQMAPTLRAGLFGALACALIGFLMNDSGIAIPAMALTVAVPLTLAACVRALQLATPTPPAPPSEPAAPSRSAA
ncbi:hypothetical protein WBK31_35330 [Nonomuraea sp. N2-4H]|uniref:hypothetical protein n=1 Tax=Nonomuraea sp. N2-4H TaxID=3128898 RepID=UPI00324830B9